MSQPRISFIIATHNRLEDLRRTLRHCQEQRWPSKEVLIVDDASTDGTYEAVRREFPEVHITRNETNRGSVASRNELLRKASGDFVIGLDDDSWLVENDACERIVRRFESESDLGIISFQITGNEFPGRSPEAGEWHCASFEFCGVAIRKAMLDRTGLLPEYFFHAYEEPDLCLRAWDSGFRVLKWNEIVVHHEYSQLNRNEQRTHRRHARNEACSVWMRYPWFLVLPMTLARLASQSRYAASRGWLLKEPRVWSEVLLRLPTALRYRRPVGVRAVKIALAAPRIRVSDPAAAWRLGKLSFRDILIRRLNGAT